MNLNNLLLDFKGVDFNFYEVLGNKVPRWATMSDLNKNETKGTEKLMRFKTLWKLF